MVAVEAATHLVEAMPRIERLAAPRLKHAARLVLLVAAENQRAVGDLDQAHAEEFAERHVLGHRRCEGGHAVADAQKSFERRRRFAIWNAIAGAAQLGHAAIHRDWVFVQFRYPRPTRCPCHSVAESESDAQPQNLIPNAFLQPISENAVRVLLRKRGDSDDGRQ